MQAGGHRFDPGTLHSPGSKAAPSPLAALAYYARRGMRVASLALVILALAACARQDDSSAPTSEAHGTSATGEATAKAPSSKPRVVVRSRVGYYDVSGSSALELRAGMHRLGPKDPADGTAYAAFTKWTAAWSRDYATAAGCAIANPRVVVRIDIELPRWREARRADADLAQQWARFVEALRRHEEGHASIARRAGRRIARRLASFRTFRSCARLERAVDAAAEQILVQTSKAEAAYDERTGHGATQGARFPPSPGVDSTVGMR